MAKIQIVVLVLLLAVSSQESLLARKLEDILSDKSETKAFGKFLRNELVDAESKVSRRGTCPATSQSVTFSAVLANYKFDGTNNAMELMPGASYGATLILCIKGQGKVNVPAVNIRKSSFSIKMWIKVSHYNKYQILYADWKHLHWQFKFGILASNKLFIDLRKDIHTYGSDPNQDLIHVEGGDLACNGNDWQLVEVRWSRLHKKATLYINGDEAGSGTTTNEDTNLRKTDSSTYEIGYKNDTNSNHFHGCIASFKVQTS